MYLENTLLTYIDPNTSQHIFSLFGPILALLATVGGLVVSSLVLLRHRIVSCFRGASAAKKTVTVCLALGGLTAGLVIVYRLVW
jgi:hypothetical protein